MMRNRAAARMQVKHRLMSDSDMTERLAHRSHAYTHPSDPELLTANELDSRVASIRFLYPDLSETLDLFEKRFEDIDEGQNIRHIVDLGHTALDHILEVNSEIL